MSSSDPRGVLFGQQTYHALFVDAPDATLVIDADGRIVAANAQVERLFGYAIAELVGEGIEQLVPDRFRPRHAALRDAYGERPTARAMGKGLDLWARHKSGREFPVEISLSPLPEQDRRLIAASVRDVTDQRRASEELRKARNQLEERVRERTSQLIAEVAQRERAFDEMHREAEMRRAAEEGLRQAQKIEAVGALTGGIAHDFNNLLTIILANLQMLADELPDESPLMEMAAGATRAAQRGAELTRKLLLFARRQRMEPAALDVNELVAGMTGMLARTLGEHIRIEEELAPGLPNVFVDPGQLEGALVNLAINARDAMPRGGRLRIDTREVDPQGPLLEAALAPGRYVSLAVTDTGMGMAPEVAARAFEPFFTTKETGKGTGLGLSMVYGFAKESRGHVALHSEAGKGTTVTLYLPVARDDQLSKRAEGGVQPKGRESILLVEDDDEVRRAAAAMVGALGYRVLQASNGADALKILKDSPGIALLFTDVVMANSITGPELAREARKLRTDLPVLYMSGHVPESVALGGELGGATQFLSKPFRKEELAQKIRAVLDAGLPGG